MIKYYMPPEWAPHTRTWLAWPSKGYTLGDNADEAEKARHTWANVARAIARFEDVRVIVDPADQPRIRQYLPDNIEVVFAPLDDAWARDIGATFVYAEDSTAKKKLAGVNWVFNGWGQQNWAKWEKDALIAEFMCKNLNVDRVDSTLVNEGGGIHVDGEGTVLVTETVQLDKNRNPNWSKKDVEAELIRCLGVSKVIWLPRGLTRDSEEFGTRGHVDIVATFASPGVVLVHDQQNPEHPDYKISKEIIDLLSNERDAKGRKLEIIRVPAPKVLRDSEGFVDYSYINHLVVNGGVILCSFDDENDEVAKRIIEDAYPGREVVLQDALPLFARGGGIHCITQHEPAL